MSTGSNPKRVRSGKGGDGSEKVVVAVKASKEISRAALVWALTHVVQPGDCITLLVVVPSHTSGRKILGFPIFAGDCASGHKRLQYGTTLDQKSDITDYCSQMMVQLHNVYDPAKVNIKIKIVSGSPCGAVAAESKRAQANWVVLDKQLKHEEKRCMDELQCNIVVMKRSQAKVLRLNLVGSSEAEPRTSCTLPAELDKPSGKTSRHSVDPSVSIRVPTATPNSSPDSGTPFTATEVGTSSVSSSDLGTSPFFVPPTKDVLKKQKAKALKEDRNLVVTSSDSDSGSISPSTTSEFQPWVTDILNVGCSSSKVEEISRGLDNTHISPSKTMLDKFSKLNKEARISSLSYRSDDLSGNVREAVSLSRNAPLGPPPLCSICQHKAPVFGKPPRWFSYAELELATGGFSQANFLAEGGFGSVHRGVLSDGQVVAVKQHRLAGSQGDPEFCSEVEVLSCAQHRNVVMLIGFCVEDKRRLLVYEYICNGSLDSHLYGRNREVLEWSSRQKIAVGAARGLRYLHEECRVGCIVHRDMRPNNILITHDFEPLVGDFGLARWQPDGDLGVETRVIGTFGYLAPEYAQSGQITEKADVYSFGVVLLELVTGRKAVDINRPKGQQCLTEWARPLLEECAYEELVDPRLGNRYSKQEVYWMLNAASLCIRRDPHVRPRMSQVLRILEGDMVVEPNYIASPRYEAGNRSARMLQDRHKQQQCSDPSLIEALENFSSKLSHETLQAAYRHREKARWISSEGL
ncbi:inactive protein kinase SELMODRAFT_444075-like [Dioscorea cayenensis subsp. rotundata]|uniref:Inactive protein kinase SELMODRAFT_444075-like n=1 Tax=Dioscorea cayennensis subsp. rotundata TaxID=55577 RepID=A0AB40CTH2_DIOCR|nr:inactive protein kinase SELMODRAFT_444075-like [Dioscorea cayenensis subsp. rotundata]